jgi:hypothetical protein
MLLDSTTAVGLGTSRPCGFWSSWSELFSSSGKSRKGATLARKRAQAKSSESESQSEFVDDEGETEVEENEEEEDTEDGVEGPFANGQHLIFGIAQAGGPGGVGSRRGEGGILSWRRLDARRVRVGTNKKPSSWGGGGLSRKSGHPAGWM